MDWSSIDSYKRDYAAAFRAALDGVSSDAVQRVCDAIVEATENKRQILVIGNGGSAAIAEHLCCDWTKGTNCEGHPVINTRSLT
jgi:D-sedoheptulose 7-phosphate isomerase